MKNTNFNRSTAYKMVSVAAIAIFAFLFAFPLYWIITGSFKTPAAINSTTPQWWPTEWVMDNYQKLLDRKSTRLNSSHPLSSRMPSSA